MNLNKSLSLENVLANAKKVSVLVLGDLMLDEYVYGTIERISPEAPVGILDWRERKIGLGGAANVASNLAHLGCRVFLAGIVGSDQSGEELARTANDLGIDTSGVVIDTDLQPRSKPASWRTGTRYCAWTESLALMPRTRCSK